MTIPPATDALACARREIAHLSSLPVMDGRLLKVIGEPEAGSQYEQLGTILRADPALDGLVGPPSPEAGHASLGAALFSHWGLPTEFATTVLNHHLAVHDGSTPDHQLLAVAGRCAHFHPDRLPEGAPVAASDLPLHEFQLTQESLPQFASEMAS